MLVLLGLLASAGGAIYWLDLNGPPIKVDVPPPNIEPIGQFDFPKTEISQIAVKLELPITALAAAANQSAPKELSGAEQNNFHSRIQNGTVQWRMFPGTIALKNTGQNIAFSLPIRGQARATGDFDATILRVPIDGSADLAGQVTGTMFPRISTNWEIDPNLVPNLTLIHANLTLGRLGTISATQLVQDLANPMIKKEAASVGPSIMRGMDIQRNLQRLWDEAHLGKPISTQPPAWGVFDPIGVSMGPLDLSVPEDLGVTMGMTVQTYVSNVPTNNSYPEPLPPLALSSTNPVNDIKIPAVIDAQELNKRLATTTYLAPSSAIGKFTASQPEVRIGQNGFLILGVTVDAKTGTWGRGFEGRIWIEAKPVFDFETQILRLTEVKLSNETREALPKPVASTIESLVVRSIEGTLQADMTRHLPKMENEIQTWLAARHLPDYMEIKIPDPKLKIIEFYTITRAAKDSAIAPGIVIVLGAKGNIIARMKSLSPTGP